MPAVAQINVNFANKNEFATQIPRSGVSTVKSISPYTLIQYLLYNREDPKYQPGFESDIEYFTYPGGYITAGNKINVKHDSDLKLRQNLDVEQSIFADKIFARRFGNTSATYQVARSIVPRSVTISPNPDNERIHFIELNLPSSTDRSIELRANSTSIRMDNTNSTNSINLSCLNFNITNDGGLANITGRLNVIDDVSLQKNVKIVGSTTENTQTFEIRNTDTAAGIMFKVDSANGNVDFEGDLNINDKFKVDSATGNTEIGSGLNAAATGDLTVFKDTTINQNLNVKGTSTLERRIVFNNVNDGTNGRQSENRRVEGIRRVNINNEMHDILNPNSNFQHDALAIGDFRAFFLQTPLVKTSNYTLDEKDNQRTILINSSSQVNITCPANMPLGLQISFIRAGSGKVVFTVPAGVSLKSTPNDSFTSLAFPNSVATVFLGSTNTYYLFGDLLPP